jgi:hydroxymethylbilane synthase
MSIIKVGTRKSQLALWQARHFQKVMERHSQHQIELVPIVTQGDRVLDKALVDSSLDKGFFTKELEDKLLAGDIHVAVHSLKDLPTQLPPGLRLGAISERGPLRDLILSTEALPLPSYAAQGGLPELSKHIPSQNLGVGTSAQRRRAQLGQHFPKLQSKLLRGNINTRIKKLMEGEYGAILLAEAGLLRLLSQEGRSLWQSPIDPQNPNYAQGQQAQLDWQGQRLFVHALPPTEFMPACAQGFLAAEIRADDEATAELIRPFHHGPAAALARAERALLRRLEAGCHAPVGGLARYEDNHLTISGKVLSLDGRQAITETLTESCHGEEQAELLGASLADRLLARGAGGLLGSSP